MIEIKSFAELKGIRVEEGEIVKAEPELFLRENTWTTRNRIVYPKPQKYNACYLEFKEDRVIAHLGYRFPEENIVGRIPVFEYGRDKLEYKIPRKQLRAETIINIENRLRTSRIHVMIFDRPDARTKYIIGHSFCY